MPGCPAVEGLVEYGEGITDAEILHSGDGLLLLFEERVGDEVGHLEQMV